MRRFLRITLKVFLVITGLLMVIAVSTISLVDRTPVQHSEEYRTTLSRLDSIVSNKSSDTTRVLSAGFSKVSITPDHPTATAGYGKRRGRQFSHIEDSLFVRTIVITNGREKVAIVSADMLIIPPLVNLQLSRRLNEIGFAFDDVMLGATHTHNGVGNWGEGATQLLYGDYEQGVVDFLTNAILESIRRAAEDVRVSQLSHGSVRLDDVVENRLVDGGPEDAYLRTITIQRCDSTRGLLMNFAAHATCLFAKDMQLSADYPGKLISLMEKDFDFVAFMAGAVGSHKSEAPEGGKECIDWTASKVAAGMRSPDYSEVAVRGSDIWSQRVPLELPDPQIKIYGHFKIRSWVFRQAFGEYPAGVNLIRVGDVVLIGAPCDFSGEFSSGIDSVGLRLGVTPIVSSFNGGYVGYITPQKRFDADHYETQLMNWYPPGMGEYLRDVMIGLMEKSSRGQK